MRVSSPRVHAKTGLTEPVRHQVRQQSDSGEGSGQQGAVTVPGRGPMVVAKTRAPGARHHLGRKPRWAPRRPATAELTLVG
jgi:hypothetical protein